ncbi:hypothetical protein [Desulfobacter latus]|uniref:HPr kinase/phosphorylase C-terminal domain-containing protein n=1 Tax=Desulfobacter latus TaxID=2292 RepID=A0A850TBF6_9BACT|nr:hypothetical protein [Desulfobacter latus]NWH04706.1 hypothetical protein [Desulfobacter latus]
MHTVDFYLYNFIKIRSVGMPSDVNRLILEQLRCFVSKSNMSSTRLSEQPDIHIECCSDLPTLNGRGEQLGSSFNFNVIRSLKSDRVMVIFNYRGVPDVVLDFTAPDVPVHISFRRRKGIARRVYGLLLFGIIQALKMNHDLLCHGAVLQKDQKGILIAGHRGIGKTMILLSLLKAGWGYIGDDKFILSDGKAYLFQDFIVLRDHHFSALPWLTGRDPDFARFAKKAKLQKYLQYQILKWLPQKILPSLDRFLNPAMRVTPDRICKQAVTLSETTISTGIVLGQGDRFEAKEISRKAFIQKFDLLQQMAIREYNDLEKMIYYYCPKRQINWAQVLDDNIHGNRFIDITVPMNVGFDSIGKKVVQCLT